MGQEPVKPIPKTYKVADLMDLLGAVSPDGRFLTYTDWRTGNLAVRDLKTGEDRHLTDKGSWFESGEYAVYSTVSPDGKQIAYGWFNQEGFLDLRVIGVDGSGARVLYRNQEIPGCQPHDWSPDGRHILASFRRKDRSYQIVLVSVADGSVQELKTLDGRSPFMWSPMSFSPDGRFIAYDFPPQEDSPDRDIFLLATDGSREIPLVEHPANDLVLGWAPDGKQFLFASDRTGSQRAWLIEVAEGKHLGEPKLVKPEIRPVRGLGFTRDGSYYYCCGVPGGPALNDVYLVTLDPATHKLQAPKKLVSDVGHRTSIDWSPDGQYLAYNKEGGWAPAPPYRFVLVVLSVESGKERRLRLNIRRSGAFQPHWSPDGRFLLAQAEDHTGGRGVYRIDAKTGEVTPIVQAPRCCIEWPVWAHDGKVIFTRATGLEPQSIVARDPESGREEELYRVVSPVGVSHLAASPDGQWLAFVWSGTDKGPTALKVMPAAGGEPRELVKLPAPRRHTFGTPFVELAWTPDSRHIIYALTIAGQKQEFEMWRISLEGGQPQRLGLAMEGLQPQGLSVHPDGRQIAFTASPLRRGAGAGTGPAGDPIAGDPIWVLENFLPEVKAVR
jgi:Tol biopolymer transport system component